MIRFRKGLLDHGGEPSLTHCASPTAGPALAAAPSPQGLAAAVLTGASSGAAASAGALGREQSCKVKYVTSMSPLVTFKGNLYFVTKGFCNEIYD
jgi:hypothetical protein